MSEAPRWTPEQEQAITARGADILVAAAAGSGKTAVLVERVIRRLTDPADPIDVDQLLVVTFTEAAATEMRDRIAAALQKALTQDPENARLQRQLALLGRAAISTLHSFCLGLIRQYFFRLGLDPSVSVMGDHEAMLLRHEVLDDLFARRFEEEPDGSFYALVDRYGGGGEAEGLRNLVLDLYDYAQSLPWPERWLADAAARFDLPDDARIDDLPWWPPIRRQVRLSLSQAAAHLEQAERLCRLPGGPAVYEESLTREAGQVRLAAEAESWDELSAAVRAIAFDRLPPVKKGSADEALQERAKKRRDLAKEAVKELVGSYFGRSEADWLADLRAVAPHLKTLVELVGQFSEGFREAKAAQSAVDFNDLERFALQLLRDPASEPEKLIPSDVARELQGRFAEILVDEYQDINAVQDSILALVARDGAELPPNRFMVGDVKQSIYRFRHADPSLFLAKYTAYRAWQGESADRGGRIVLGANFRSRAGVVDGTNFLFRQIMSHAVGELDYDSAAELVCRAGYPTMPGQAEEERPAGPPVEVQILDRSEPDSEVEPETESATGTEAQGDSLAAEGDALADLNTTEREARLIATRMKALVEGDDQSGPLMVWDKGSGGYRPVRYRDIVVLMRATTGRANLYLEVFSAAGIPAYAQLSTGYFAATEVEVVLSLLQLLDNPRQDIPLAAVLRSPIMGLATDDLARIRLANPRGSFYEALVAAAGAREAMDESMAEVAVTVEVPALAHKAPTADAGLAQTLATFLAALERWRTLARRRPLSQVVWQIYQETGYLHYVGGMPGGAQRRANLLALYDRARQFDQFARQGLFRFLRFIERLRDEEADMGAALALGEGEDVVRLMSIHKSKGLEFPVVFVASMGGSFARQDLAGDMLLQGRLGFGPQMVDPDLRARYPTLAYHAAREAIRLEALAEELRVLYVALTRARERLILVGSVRDLPKRCAAWASAAGVKGWVLPDAILASAESYLDWVGPALLRHRNGGPLRQLAGLADPADAQVAADPSQWHIQIWDLASQQRLLGLAGAEEEATTLDWERIGALEPLDLPYDPAVGEELASRFAWRYPYEDLVRRFGKLSVTELKGQFNPDAEQPLPGAPVEEAELDKPRRRGGSLTRSPRFMQQGKASLTPTELGTLMHLVLQHLDLIRPLDEAGVAAQVAELVEREVITADQAAAVAVDPIARFFASPLGERIRRRPDRVRREVSFTLAIPAAEVYRDLDPALTAGESVIVQGMIDLLLEEEEGFVLVDYKTDRREPEEAAKRYGVQIGAYRRAVEEILGRPVVEAYLHFLASDHSVRME